MREQMTFYRSFWEAAKRIKKKDDRLSILEAIIAYALDEEERPMTDVAEGLFILIKPTLDASKRKALSGKTGGSAETNRKQTESKPEANAKQTGMEKEKEVEIEVEIENKCSARDVAFDAFWSAYPKKVGKGAASVAFKKIKPKDFPLLVPAVERQKQSKQWQRDGGQYIPNPATWLNQQRWLDEVQDAAPGVRDDSWMDEYVR